MIVSSFFDWVILEIFWSMIFFLMDIVMFLKISLYFGEVVVMIFFF